MDTNKMRDLKALAEACLPHQPLRFMRSHGALYIRNDNGIVFDVHQNRSFPDLMAQNKDYADLALVCTPDTVLALLAEIDLLKADLGSTAHDQDQLKAENEVLRKDAENWQTVHRAMDQLKSDEQGAAIWSACSRILISLASDLNSARSVVTEEGVTKDGAEIGDWRVTVERLAMAKETSHG